MRLEQHFGALERVEPAARGLDVDHGVDLVLANADLVAEPGQVEVCEAGGCADETGGTQTRERRRIADFHQEIYEAVRDRDPDKAVASLGDLMAYLASLYREAKDPGAARKQPSA